MQRRGVRGGEGDLPDTDAEVGGQAGAGGVQQPPGGPTLPVQAPGVGPAVLQRGVVHLAGGGQHRRHGGGVEVGALHPAQASEPAIGT